MSWFRSRYVEHLEAENARLVDENRRLLNIMLPRLGFNPLDEPAPKDPKKARTRLTWLQWGKKRAAELAKVPREIVIRDPKPLEQSAVPRPERPNGDPAQSA
jgi:hypothetical protein